MAKRVTVRPPVLARTEEQLCAMERDNVERGGHWALVDGANIVIANQKNGQAPTGMVTVPHDVFLRFVRWYLTGDHDMRAGVNAWGLSKVVKDAL